MNGLGLPVIDRRQILGVRRGAGLEGLHHELVAVRGCVKDAGKVAPRDGLDLGQLLVDRGAVVEGRRCAVLLGDLETLSA